MLEYGATRGQGQGQQCPEGQVQSFESLRLGYPITSPTTSRSVLMSATERWPMTRKTSPCSMVVKIGLSTGTGVRSSL